MKIIKFHRLSDNINYLPNGTSVETWEIAFSQKHLNQKLNGEMAEIIMPAKSWPVRLWRKIFPLKGIEAEIGKTYILNN